MQSSDLPTRMPTVFARDAVAPYVHQVPDDNATPSDGKASFVTGFPPVNFSPVASGGIPPWGNDFNGLLKQYSQWLRWMQAGGTAPYDPNFQIAIGGYPLGCIIASVTVARQFWISTAENNLSNPDAGGANWQSVTAGNSGVSAATYTRPQLIVNAEGKLSSVAQAPYPTRQFLNSLGAGTYTRPSAVGTPLFLIVYGIGGGGGSGATLGGVGGTTTFNSVTAIGGSPGALAASAVPGQGGIGGTGGSPAQSSNLWRFAGAQGGKGAGGSSSGSPVGAIVFAGGVGGGAGLFGRICAPDVAGLANSGQGAGGITTVNNTGGPGASFGGGGGGEGFILWIPTPAASYAFTVGAGGIAGTSGFAGGSGVIVVEEYYF